MSLIVSCLRSMASILLAGRFFIKLFRNFAINYELKKEKEVMNDIQEKINNGTITDEYIIAANRKLRESKK